MLPSEARKEGKPADEAGGGFFGFPSIAEIRELVQESLADVGRLLVVIVGTLALVGLASALIIAGLLSLLGFKPGDVAKFTPPGRAAAVAEIAVR